MARANIRRPRTYPCTSGGNHRWKVRETHHRMDDGGFVLDDWCIRCGEWLTDIVVRKGDT